MTSDIFNKVGMKQSPWPWKMGEHSTNHKIATGGRTGSDEEKGKLMEPISQRMQKLPSDSDFQKEKAYY